MELLLEIKFKYFDTFSLEISGIKQKQNCVY